MPVKYEYYRAKKVVNIHKRPDPWFWDKYSAHPYKGCEHACEYCYTREEKYSPYSDPADFSKVIKIKTNAAKLLRKEIAKLPRDVMATGDYQPIEKETGLPAFDVLLEGADGLADLLSGLVQRIER